MEEGREEKYYEEAFSRNIGIFSKGQQERLRCAKVAIAGMGGVGSNYILALTRLGIGKFAIADFDIFEMGNVNRQAGANVNSFGRDKCGIMKEMAQSINPNIQVEIFPQGVNPGNVRNFVEGADVVIDGLDFFSIKERRMLFRQARKSNVYVITSPPIGFGASLLTFAPDKMSFDRYFDVHDGMADEEQMLHFAIGLSPTMVHKSYFQVESIDFSKHKASSLAIGPITCTSFVASEVARILFGRKVHAVPWVFQFDPFSLRYKKSYLPFGNRSFIQRIKIWYIKNFLISKSNSN